MSEVREQSAGWLDELALRAAFLLTVTALVLGICSSLHLGG